MDHPEGVVWGKDGYIYVGGEAGQIYRIEPDTGNFTQIASTSGFILGSEPHTTLTQFLDTIVFPQREYLERLSVEVEKA